MLQRPQHARHPMPCLRRLAHRRNPCPLGDGARPVARLQPNQPAIRQAEQRPAREYPEVTNCAASERTPNEAYDRCIDRVRIHRRHHRVRTNAGVPEWARHVLPADLLRGRRAARASYYEPVQGDRWKELGR
jgi:hypothetical protein